MLTPEELSDGIERYRQYHLGQTEPLGRARVAREAAVRRMRPGVCDHCKKELNLIEVPLTDSITLELCPACAAELEAGVPDLDKWLRRR